MKTRILMVCLGNICRSPLAEGILGSKVDPAKVQVDSAGTAGYHIGKSPDPRSMAVAREHGLEIGHQRCRKVSRADFMRFDLIYAMDRDNYANLIEMAPGPEEAAKVRMILEGLQGEGPEVPDPYYGTARDFEQVYEILDRACGALAKKLN